jgi:hypothetical protein
LENRIQIIENATEERKKIDSLRDIYGSYEMKFLKNGKPEREDVGLYGDVITGRDILSQQLEYFKIVHLAYNENNNEFIFLVINLMEGSSKIIPIVFRKLSAPMLSLISIEKNSPIYELKRIGN